MGRNWEVKRPPTGYRLASQHFQKLQCQDQETHSGEGCGSPIYERDLELGCLWLKWRKRILVKAISK